MIDDVLRAGGWPLLLEAGVTDAEARAFAVPTGTVTFLLTDVESSTRGWEASPDAMTVAIARHYELLDGAISAHGGVRPVEQGEGDSVVGAFGRSSDAIAAALAAQQALLSEPWPEGGTLRVRMAIHTGEAQLRGDGNYFGQPVIRCARIRATGHGGQVLLSDATAALVADHLPADAALLDLGLHRLKDLGRPDRVWQLVHPDLPAEHPPLRSLDSFRHNLPSQVTPLIGRVADIEAVTALVDTERLVTLTGPGGVGKTRLAMAVCAEVIERWPGGVLWVELATVLEQDAVGRAVLAALRCPEVPGVTPAQQLAGELAEGPALIVLDNCEHLLDGCGRFVMSMLAALPSVSILATSREPVGVPGEVIWPVPSLGVPPTERSLDVPSLSQYDAVRLFVDRAHRARPSFVVNDANAPAIAQVCHRLDGIPLAIELAAARCRQMTAEHIERELDNRFRLLTGGTRGVVARQQTLMASIDWSFERLDEVEQRIFRRLGVFVGSFPLEAAEAIASSCSDVEPVEVFDALSHLVDKCLVVVGEDRDGEPLYRQLETIRAYAVERARQAGELAQLQASHAQWWTSWLSDRWLVLHTEAVADVVEQFHGNVASALLWSVSTPELGLRLLFLVCRAWLGTSRLGDAMTAFDALITPDNARLHGPAWRDAALAGAPFVVAARGYEVFVALLNQVKAEAEAASDRYHEVRAAWMLSMTDTVSLELRDLAREHGDPYLQTIATVTAAQWRALNDPLEAQDLLREATLVAESSGNRFARDWVTRVRGYLARDTGDLAHAMELAETLIDRGAVERGLPLLISAAFLAADADRLAGAVTTAEAHSRRMPGEHHLLARAIRRQQLLTDDAVSAVDDDLDNWIPTSGTLWVDCREAIAAGAADEAVAAVERHDYDSPHSNVVRSAILAATTGSEDAWHEALRVAVEHDLRLISADALEGIAVAAAESESWTECLRLAGAAERLRDETGYRWRFAPERDALAGALQAARTALSPDEAAAALLAGRNLDDRAAAAFAARSRGTRKRPKLGWASLTPTELEVVALVSQGLTNPQIAGQLLMGRATVKTHLDHIFVKLGVQTRTEVAAAAIRREATQQRRSPAASAP
ncbi:MAG TPA: LuxR C-terminal-related transcriptional regulator [Nocardioidaceae bacterium]